jgi:hypothetical protein
VSDEERDERQFHRRRQHANCDDGRGADAKRDGHRASRAPRSATPRSNPRFVADGVIAGRAHELSFGAEYSLAQISEAASAACARVCDVRRTAEAQVHGAPCQ